MTVSDKKWKKGLEFDGIMNLLNQMNNALEITKEQQLKNEMKKF